MKHSYTLLTLCSHTALLVLASTKLSVLSWIWGDHSWTWQYFRHTYKNGWGYQYKSDYSLFVVLAYIAAYLVGVVGYGMSRRHVHGGWNLLAGILSLFGLISFLIEGSHWFWNHHLSWIAICPAASLILAIVVIVQLGRKQIAPAEQTPADVLKAAPEE
jgi:hypothetical protein